MRNRHQKKSKKIKAVCLAEGEKIPAGYTVKGTAQFFNQKMLVAVPDRILNQPDLVKKMIANVKSEFMFFNTQAGDK